LLKPARYGETITDLPSAPKVQDVTSPGFTRGVLPAANVETLDKAAGFSKMQLMGVRTAEEAMERLF
jgi:hypothetical protein